VLLQALEVSGVQRAAAEQVATGIYEAIHNNDAARADLERVAEGLFAAVRADLRETEQRLHHKIGAMVTGFVVATVVALTVLFGALHYWPPHP
jgi:hypothetical protein